MKSFALSLALAGALLFCSGNTAWAAGINAGVNLGFASAGVQLQLGTTAFNQRYVPVGKAWVNEPYIWWQNVPDPVSGRVYRVQRIAYTRRLVVLYYDTWQGGYGYFDRFGNPVPWNTWRYHW